MSRGWRQGLNGPTLQVHLGPDKGGILGWKGREEVGIVSREQKNMDRRRRLVDGLEKDGISSAVRYQLYQPLV